MRIIAGEHRGRRLLAPASEVTRPITDRAKQSLFDILAPRIQGAVVYDCFAGTGSMGLEALSRQAAKATFFERDRDGVRRLRKNIEALGVGERANVVDVDIFKWFAAAAADQTERVNIVFFDPPYRMLIDRPVELQQLAATIAKHYLHNEGVLIFRHDAKDQLNLTGLRPIEKREYGGMAIEFLADRL